MLHLFVPTPYGKLALTGLNVGGRSDSFGDSLRNKFSDRHDDCSVSGKLTIEGRDYFASVILTRKSGQFATLQKWQMVNFVDDSSHLPRVWNMTLRSWLDGDVSEAVDITPDIEASLDYVHLSARAFAVVYQELRKIMLTPNWQQWVELEEQTGARFEAYQHDACLFARVRSARPVSSSVLALARRARRLKFWRPEAPLVVG